MGEWASLHCELAQSCNCRSQEELYDFLHLKDSGPEPELNRHVLVCLAENEVSGLASDEELALVGPETW